MTIPMPAAHFADPAPGQRLERAAAALTAHGFTVEILDAAVAARARVKDLIPEGASVFTGASETPSPVRHRGGHQHQRALRRRQATRPGPGPRPRP